MRSLPRPAFIASHVMHACIQSIRDANLSGRLAGISNIVDGAEATYHLNGLGMTLYGVPSTNGVNGMVTTAEMMRVYSGTFVKSVRTRAMYDALKAAP